MNTNEPNLQALPTPMWARVVQVMAAMAATFAIALAWAAVPVKEGALPQAAPISKGVTQEPPAGAIRLTASEKTELERRTSTPEGRAEILRQLKEAFSGVAEVGVTEAQPAPTNTAPASMRAVTSVYTSSSATVVPAYAQGITGNHFWVVVSYADAIRGGAVATAVQACARSWWLVAICGAVGTVLNGFVQGWPAVNNHGAWVELYWSPVSIRGGRW